MKFRCERDALVDRLTTSSRAVSNRGGALPVLTGMHLSTDGDVLTITGSDLDLTVRSTVSVAVDEPGVAVLPARLTVDIVRSLDSGVGRAQIQRANALRKRSPTPSQPLNRRNHV